MKALENAKGFLAPVDSVAEANQQFSLLATALEEYINKMYNEWLLSVQPTVSKRLEVPLMTRSSEAGLLENNFDLHLLKYVLVLFSVLTCLFFIQVIRGDLLVAEDGQGNPIFRA